jgi:hypothetical protein
LSNGEQVGEMQTIAGSRWISRTSPAPIRTGWRASMLQENGSLQRDAVPRRPLPRYTKEVT